MSVHHTAFCSEMFSWFHTTGLIFSPDLGTTVSSLLGHLSIVACGQFWLSGLVRALPPILQAALGNAALPGHGGDTG